VHFHELAHDGEAEAEPGLRPRGPAVRLTERLEDVRQKIRRDADDSTIAASSAAVSTVGRASSEAIAVLVRALLLPAAELAVRYHRLIHEHAARRRRDGL
jgi:hypothetical protein